MLVTPQSHANLRVNHAPLRVPGVTYMPQLIQVGPRVTCVTDTTWSHACAASLMLISGSYIHLQHYLVCTTTVLC